MNKIVIVVLVFMQVTYLNAQKILPYLQACTEQSIWINWKTEVEKDAYVVYGLSKDNMEYKAEGLSEKLDSNYIWHSVQLLELEPNTRYFYKVYAGEEQSEMYEFKTFPSQEEQNGHFRFVVLGDHQVMADDRYEKLVSACKRKITELYGEDITNKVSLIINDGDQVDVGGDLNQYQELHFKQGSALNTILPSMTVIGNHEYYKDKKLFNYFSHFKYEDLAYQGMYGTDGEHYYAFQASSILFLMLDSNQSWDRQAEWVKEIVEKAEQDEEVKWIVTVAHHPIMAEQYIDDVSTFMRDAVIPELVKSKKSILFIAGHHHLYHRGQLNNDNLFHIISGGASWDQRWGQSEEKDLEEVQKTIDQFNYQIVDVNLEEETMDVYTYSIGNKDLDIDNQLIDHFFKKIGISKPSTPQIKSISENENDGIIIIESTSYKGEIPLNSTEFLIAKDADFKEVVLRNKRDFENLFGSSGPPLWETIDLNENVNILEWEIKNLLTEGSYYVKVRHRDQNLNWSEWSEVKNIKVKNDRKF
ncbi:fibronectin type III domain-containing protein [Portibacter lacus]|uniref:Phosphohydrolase n=1 Tax=Portibacter lacus TaxID=1099794 RepID=A0AA37SQA9_9BACT|nr:fibronectin type III domain-containing protein [Portibacter lacus]GLR16881.1 hypothetical protein GCM10007940_14960 [Portibacter lacus]